MTISWLMYALVVAALVSVAAWLAERGARAQRWPTRWVWAGALAVSVVGPVVAWLLPTAPAAAPVVGVPGAYVLGSLSTLTAGPVGPAGPSPEMLVLAGWGVLSAVLLGVLGVLAVRLARRGRRWPRRMVDGVEVLVSRRTGPAAMGVLRARVVVPEWALRLNATERRFLVLHEAEHVRARDPQLAMAGLVVCILAPWNLPLWWQLRRLRLAIEMDCDARVLRRSPDPRSYGSLLVTVGQRKSHLMLALAESPSMLERRIRMITTTAAGRGTVRAIALAGMAALVLAVACETPGPTGPSAVEQKPLELDATRTAVQEMECQPLVYVNGKAGTLGPVDPDNVDEIHVLKPLMDEEGAVADRESCGVIVVVTKDASVEEADASRRLMEKLVRERMARLGPEARGVPQEQTLEAVEAEPTFTPMTVRPQVKNADEVAEALERNYPPLLKDAGIEGTANVWLLIDREGTVRQTRINEGSGHTALDEAALGVANQMDFTPAYNRDERVPVWVAMDITFGTAAVSEREALSEEERREVRQRIEERRRELAEELEKERARTEERRRELRKEVDAERGDVAQEPTFTPMTVAPRLKNSQEMARMLQRYYPPPLRDAGIGGSANVWFFIDETGRVAQVQINESSGHEALDGAALAVAREMEFEPALNRDERVAVWVAIDITFEVQ